MTPVDAAAGLEMWLAEVRPWEAPHWQTHATYADRVDALRSSQAELFDAGWARLGWPIDVGGLGGSVLHRAAIWETLARYGHPGMAVLEHLEILGPVLVSKATPAFARDVMPAFLAGKELFCQGFSEPDAGSDLASLRTVAVKDGDGYRITGRKIWTSWAKYARWCLVLARTGAPDSKHRGLSALVVDLQDDGVEVQPIIQGNGTDEFAEVAFDGVFVPASRLVGDLHGGWGVAMDILAHERGTFGWFRQCFLRAAVAEYLGGEPTGDRPEMGDALLDLAAVACSSWFNVESEEARTLGVEAAITKMLLGRAEQAALEALRRLDPAAIALPADEDEAVLQQEYLFSRAVTIYGGSQQMQLETIASRLLGMPK